MTNRIPFQIANGTAAAWTAANPTLLAGEFGFETDSYKLKAGDGSTAWTSLNYIGGSGSVTSVSTSAANNGITATWATGTTTPALTIGLGAITPTSVAASTTVSGTTITASVQFNGSGAGLTNVPWSELISIPTNVLSFGNLANSSGWLYNNGSGTLSYSTPSVAFSALTSTPANITSFGSLANAAGWLYNNGSGTLSYSTPSVAFSALTSTPANITSFGSLANSAGYLYNNGSGTLSYSTSVGNLNYTQTGGSTSLTLQQFFDSGYIDIRSFGAVSGTGNNTTAIQNAINYAATNNVRVYIPAGVWACNLAITGSYTNIFGPIHGSSRGQSSTCCLVPWDITKPVITVGSDSSSINVYGTSLRNIAFNGVGPNGTGVTGLYLGGGAQFGVYEDLAMYQFANGTTGWGLKIGPSSEQPIQYNNFVNIDISGHTTTNYTAALGVYYGTGTSWTTANYFFGLQLNGNTFGWAVELDSSQIYIFGGWIQTISGHSLHTLKSQGQNPLLSGSCNWEASGGQTVINSHDTTPYSSAWVSGSINFAASGGTPQMVDSASTAHNMNEPGLERYADHVLGPLSFNSTSDTDPTVQTRQIYSDSSGNIFLQTTASTSSQIKLGTDGGLYHTSSGKQAFKVTSGTSGVNSIGISTGTTGNGANIYGIGGDTNFDINISPNGTGRVVTPGSYAMAKIAAPANDASHGMIYTNSTDSMVHIKESNNTDGIILTGAKGNVSGTSASPAGTTSTTAVMGGLGLLVTPKLTGNIFITLSGQVANSVINDGSTVDLRYGTGSAPSNGNAVSGTLVGIAQTFTSLVAADKHGFCLQGYVTGLTVGTAYWIDFSQLAITAGTTTVTGVQAVALEQ